VQPLVLAGHAVRGARGNSGLLPPPPIKAHLDPDLFYALRPGGRTAAINMVAGGARAGGTQFDNRHLWLAAAVPFAISSQIQPCHGNPAGALSMASSEPC
jgi:hypothetical protein